MRLRRPGIFCVSSKIIGIIYSHLRTCSVNVIFGRSLLQRLNTICVVAFMSLVSAAVT